MMITDTFDGITPDIIAPRPAESPVVDVCVITFSYLLSEYVREHLPCRPLTELRFCSGGIPVYRFPYKGKEIAFFMAYPGASLCAGAIENLRTHVNVERFVVFGGAGCLDREIVHGGIMVPTEAYRDEGTSYHYAPASDYIRVRNSDFVADCMEDMGLTYVTGRTWTTDAFYRETRGNFSKRKAEGCISVEMECAGLQALCDFRGLEFYTFFTSSDLLDAPQWQKRQDDEQAPGTQHDLNHLDIALELAYRAANR